jgi:hypothetical protein
MRNSTDTAEEENELLGSTSPPATMAGQAGGNPSSPPSPSLPRHHGRPRGRRDADPPRQRSAPRRLSKGLAPPPATKVGQERREAPTRARKGGAGLIAEINEAEAVAGHSNHRSEVRHPRPGHALDRPRVQSPTPKANRQSAGTPTLT